jgi:2-polyprenyl-3-methyl-5-hydroxy-6-metoxy-1,4-benzoquinol methylase
MLSKRSYEKELLDQEYIPTDELYQNLKELEFINKYLGGHRISLSGLSRVLNGTIKYQHIVDIGCGGGDSLKAMAVLPLLVNEKSDYRLTGIDLKKDCITYARRNCRHFPKVQFVCADFREILQGRDKPDILHASLFCHHFTEEEIISFIRLCLDEGVLFIINDLQRNVLAYYSIRLLTTLFSKSSLVKNDAPLSVRRGFRKKEWKAILQEAGAKTYTIENRWAFRHLIIIYPHE